VFTRINSRSGSRLGAFVNPIVSMNGGPSRPVAAAGVQPLEPSGPAPRAHSIKNVSIDTPDEARRMQDGGAPSTPVPAAPDAGVPDAGAPAAKPTLATSNDKYDDNASESRKNIKFEVTVPSGVTARDYALVNFVKGSMKNGAGKYFKATMYGKQVDANYSDWKVDSVDEDPVYWSTSSGRWNFKTSSTGFYATDSPGPALTSEHGAIYALRFKIGLFKLADVPTTTTGTIAATPLQEIPWDYSVVVSDKGTFTHPAL